MTAPYPRVSASPQEAKPDADGVFFSDNHGSLQSAEEVHIQVRGWIHQVDLGDVLAVTPCRGRHGRRTPSRAAGSRAAHAVGRS